MLSKAPETLIDVCVYQYLHREIFFHLLSTPKVSVSRLGGNICTEHGESLKILGFIKLQMKTYKMLRTQL